MTSLTLIILAGGLGTRFGGPKQFFPLGPNDECLFHYSLFHAMQNGVDRLILLTRSEVLPQAQEAVKGLPIPIEIVLQKTPNGKPRGTAHAVISCLPALETDQAIVINADDYYRAATFIATQKLSHAHPQAATVPYLLKNTLSEYGGVSRAICTIEDDYLVDIQETHKIVRAGDHANGEANGQSINVALDAPVSMNCFLLSRSLIELMAQYVQEKLDNQTSAEITLPDFLQHEINHSDLKVHTMLSDSEWFGLTFKEDIDSVKSRLKQLHKSGMLPPRLW
ncbi:MAG: NTP transferase domain-containing protein [Fimbriimonadaceae bacterium]|nr:MAG: NTP transferase domain-containing protein [Fimbriimonadaceae bacterium]